MTKIKSPYVCPSAFAGSLDNFLRRMIHNPQKILGSYVKEGMNVLDLGCGPGYFTSTLAKLAGAGGRVVAADIQQGMLDRMLVNVTKSGFAGIVDAHLCKSDSVGISGEFNFILAFWMVHEVPDQKSLFAEVKSLLKPDGRFLIVEPRIHVSGKDFRKMQDIIESEGLRIIGTPEVPLSRSVLLSAGSSW